MECVKEKESGSAILATSILDSLVMIAKMDLVNIFGPMATITKAIFVKT